MRCKKCKVTARFPYATCWKKHQLCPSCDPDRMTVLQVAREVKKSQHLRTKIKKIKGDDDV